MHQAFAISCNTAFIGLATQLPPGALADAARAFGFGASYNLPLPTTGGKFPDDRRPVEFAASAIGQARVTVSPLHLATVAGTAASGQWRPPVLVLQPSASNPPSSLPPALAPAVVDSLRSLMTEVVTSGTGHAAARRGQAIAGQPPLPQSGAPNPRPPLICFLRGNLPPPPGSLLKAAPRGVR